MGRTFLGPVVSEVGTTETVFVVSFPLSGPERHLTHKEPGFLFSQPPMSEYYLSYPHFVNSHAKDEVFPYGVIGVHRRVGRGTPP